VTVLLLTPTALALQAKIFGSDYVAKVNMEAELTSGALLLEVAVVMGVASPIVLPLTACAFMTQSMAFHRAVKTCSVENDARPPFRRLVGSMVLSVCLNVWFFHENADEFGCRLLVYIGIPLSCVIGQLVSMVWVTSTQKVAQLITTGNMSELGSWYSHDKMRDVSDSSVQVEMRLPPGQTENGLTHDNSAPSPEAIKSSEDLRASELGSEAEAWAEQPHTVELAVIEI